MSAKLSAGLLLFRRTRGLELLIAHMGGPFWSSKEDHAWSIPKGEYDKSEDAFDAACREFAEELGSPAPELEYVGLGTETLPGGKRLSVWAGEADFDAENIRSNTFELQWPPRSGRSQAFPEIDRAAWCDPGVARARLVASQTVFLDNLLAVLR